MRVCPDGCATPATQSLPPAEVAGSFPARCCSAVSLAVERRLRLDGVLVMLMKSTSPTWVWVGLELALLLIGYVVTPPVVIRQAATL